MIKKFLFLALIGAAGAGLFFGCKNAGDDLKSAMAGISADTLAENTKLLASDEFEGRFPASAGEEKTVRFLEEEFQKLSLKPGNGESFFQEIPMVEITADPNTELQIRSRKQSKTFAYGSEFAALTLRVVPEVSLKNSEMVFVGYGIIAPEYNWNDYEGLDVRGKTVVMLINDPGFATGDPKLFNGKAMTYYGRWTYKFEEAARQGADGALIIHETEPAAYGWEVVWKGWTGPNFNLISEDNNLSRCAVEGWIQLDTAHQVFAMAEKNFEELKAAAAKPGFKPVPLDVQASLNLKNSIRHVQSRNVAALLPGHSRPDEYIIFVAHWDHFGIDPTLQGDQIFNGAVDNATGTAGLIELAKAYRNFKTPPARSILFLAVTGEEQGLLGSTYYAANPLFPSAKTVAAINMDALNVYGKMKDVTVIGYGNSELDAYVEAAAQEQNRRVRPDPNPERGSYYRSDHFPFASQGIPALYISSGIDHVEYGEEWTQTQRKKYLVEKYHKTSDEFDPGWDLSGAVEDLHLTFKVGYLLSMESAFPNWKEGSEFKARRDAARTAAKK
ncbi:MAG: M28 family metallopeptidase [Candidatus Aminicenantales bacterium]